MEPYNEMLIHNHYYLRVKHGSEVAYVETQIL